MWLLLLILVILIAIIVAISYLGSVDDALIILGSNRSTIVLIPGLGNGIESFNWNLSTIEQRAKTNITDPKYMTSLQDKLSKYRTVVFTEPASNEYFNRLESIKPDLIIGHSIGGRVAQYYGEKNHIPYIMLDPTPDYILDKVYTGYTKHLENPKYQPIHDYLKMVESHRSEIKALPWRPSYLIYSVDEIDPSHIEKRDYFRALQCNKIELYNATHWVHITHQDLVLDCIDKTEF